MSMIVPDCPAWRGEPGFVLARCHCVRVCGEPVADCLDCNGSGEVGLVPVDAWSAARSKGDMPSLPGDTRFDPPPDADGPWPFAPPAADPLTVPWPVGLVLAFLGSVTFVCGYFLGALGKV